MGAGRGRPRTLALLLHQLVEARVVHRETLLVEQLAGEVVGKAVRVVQAEGVARVDPRGAAGPGLVDQLREQLRALLERAAEALLLGGQPAVDRVPLRAQLRVGVAHDLDHAVGEPAQERRLDADRAPLLDRAAHHPPQDVAAVLVRRHDPVRDQEAHRAAVVGEHAQRLGGRDVRSVAPARQLLAEIDERPELVRLEHGGNVLEDRGHPLQPQPRVDVSLRERLERAVLVQRVLHEDEIPVLQEALRVIAGAIVLGAENRAAIYVELGARSAGTDRARLPEVLRAREAHDALVRHAHRAPALDRLLVRTQAQLRIALEHRDPDVLRVEPEAVQGQLPRMFDGALLEVVAEREVAQHLEEGQVPCGGPDLVDVGRAEALLARGQAWVRRRLLTQEVRLEGLHAGRREEHRGVVRNRDQRARRHAPVVARLEEGEERLADLCRGAWPGHRR